MAKKALVNKAKKKPKFAVRAYTRCNKCGRPHAVYRKFGLCRICLREMAHAGEVLFEGSPDEIVHDPEVRRVYLGDLYG